MTEKIKIKSDFIKLESLLKFASLVGSGGEAKLHISYGEVTVNGETCTARGKKIRAGDTVKFGDTLLEIE